MVFQRLSGESSRSPLVSIAIPAYKPGAVFEDTLQSCLRQGYDHLEIVVSADGPDEELASVVRKMNDGRVRLVGGDVRLGQFQNFNRAMSECSGEFIKLLSADDLMTDDCIVTMVRALDAHPDIDLCTTRHISFASRADGELEPWLELPCAPFAPIVLSGDEARWYTAWHGNQIGGPSNVMIRRRGLWRTGGFDPRPGLCGEPALWYRMTQVSGAVILTEPLIAYRLHSNSVTGRGTRSVARVAEPFMIAETATLGATLFNGFWWERLLRRLQTVNSTAGFAVAVLRSDVRRGVRAMWVVVTAGGMLQIPLNALVAGLAILRSSIFRVRSQWPFRDPWRVRRVEWQGCDVSQLMGTISDASRRRELLDA